MLNGQGKKIIKNGSKENGEFTDNILVLGISYLKEGDGYTKLYVGECVGLNFKD